MKRGLDKIFGKSHFSQKKASNGAPGKLYLGGGVVLFLVAVAAGVVPVAGAA